MATKRKRAPRFAKVPDEQVQRQWLALRPRAIKATLVFLAAALSIFLANHFFPLGQTMVNIVNVAFQICCVFSVCGAFMIAMTFIYGRPQHKSSAAR